MSRGQQTQVFDTAKGQNENYDTLANTSFNKTQGDITSYGDTIGKFEAANPYQRGGEAQVAGDQQLADTAAGQAEAAGQAVQSAAVRTGQNAGGAIAATEHMNEDNTRTLLGAEAGATDRRLAGDTGYREAGVGMEAGKVGMQNEVAKEEAGAAQGTLSTEEQAAQTPSFMDTLGSSFASQLGKTLGGGNLSLTKQI